MVVALAVRRLGLGVPQAAAHFVVPQAFVTDALRTLDGVLTRIGASAVHAPIGPLLARMTGEWERFERPVHEGVTVADVQRAVARVFGISIADLISPRKSRDLVTPRHIAIYLARRFTLGSMPSIGRAFGGRHHTTAINAVERIEPFGKAVAARLPLDATLPDWARALRDEMTNDCRDASAGGAAAVSSSVRAGSPAIKSQTGSRQSQT
jgi:chromosomal replication initiator protein